MALRKGAAVKKVPTTAGGEEGRQSAGNFLPQVQSMRQFESPEDA